jgi:hypothetical protein
MTAQAPEPALIESDDVMSIDVAQLADGTRIVVLNCDRLNVHLGFGMGDAAMLARGFAGAVKVAMELNQADAAKSGSSIILPASRH